jgi:hypothetical protein
MTGGGCRRLVAQSKTFTEDSLMETEDGIGHPKGIAKPFGGRQELRVLFAPEELSTQLTTATRSADPAPLNEWGLFRGPDKLQGVSLGL